MKTLIFQVVNFIVGKNKEKTHRIPVNLLLQNGEVLPLKIVTYTTVSISLVALLITFILLVLIRTLRSNLHSIHKNLVAALFFSELVFLIGINQTENPVRVTLCLLLGLYWEERFILRLLPATCRVWDNLLHPRISRKPVSLLCAF